MTNENGAQVTEAKPKVELTISQIKEDLKNGIDRDGIKEKYGLRRVDVVRLFQNKELKGLKVHRSRPATSKSKATIGFILKDDNGNDITSTVFPAAKDSAESTTTESTDEQAPTAPTESVVSEDATASSW